MIQYHEIDTSKWASNGKMLPNTEVLLPRIDGSTISIGRCSGMEPHIILNDEDLVFRIRVAVQKYEWMTFYPREGFGYSDDRYYTLEALAS